MPVQSWASAETLVGGGGGSKPQKGTPLRQKKAPHIEKSVARKGPHIGEKGPL